MLLLSEEKYLRINISRINDHKRELALGKKDIKKKITFLHRKCIP